MSGNDRSDNLHSLIQQYWEAESCGERYAEGEETEFYQSHALARYEIEPWIKPFARFEDGKGKEVLEIGVGMGADYLEWLKAGASAVGIDFTARAIIHTRKRCRLAGYAPSLIVGDAERIPFSNDSFDMVYCWGVAHHSPDTAAVFREIARVLRPGGTARIAIYHYPSLGAFLIWGRNALLKGKPFLSVRSVVSDHLESPGTKLFTIKEAQTLCSPFSSIRQMRTQLGLGDLLTMKLSSKYSDPLSKLFYRMYPRSLIRLLGQNWGGYLLIECQK
jgi:ubiquinone/menaquinone biosynthesis C-methylase UbiE